MSRSLGLFLFLFLSTSLLFANEKLVTDVNQFIKWLESHQVEIGKCLPKKTATVYQLCDGTEVDRREIEKLFRGSVEEVVSFVKDREINLEVFCKDQQAQGVFKKYCVAKKRKEFEKISTLHGQFLPLENTILLHSSASKGSLIHEYIHYLQYKNKKEFFGKRYKFERVELQKRIVAGMDSIIVRVSEIQQKGESNTKVSPFLSEMVQLAGLLKSFSKWQDLIDERNIFQLYLLYGKDLGVEKVDLELAKTNMGFICKRSDVRALLSDDQCTDDIDPGHLKKYFSAVRSVVEEIRPRPDLKLVKKFVENVPKVSKKQSLEEKVELLKSYVYKNWNMKADDTYLSRKQLDNILPDSALEHNRAHCVGLTSLFLIGGEAMGLNGYLVRIPKHVFPRFCQEKKCLNVETLKDGLITDDDYYFKNGYITKESVKGTSYLKSLDTESSLKSSLYLSLGYIAGNAQQLELAEYLYKKAIDNGRDFAEGYSNLASVYAAKGKGRQARVYLRIALQVNPKHSPSQLNMGVLFFKEGKLDSALKHYNRAIIIDPLFVEAYLKRSELFEKKGDKKKMLLDLERALAIQPKLCSIISRVLGLEKDSKRVVSYRSDLTKYKEANECISVGN